MRQSNIEQKFLIVWRVATMGKFITIILHSRGDKNLANAENLATFEKEFKLRKRKLQLFSRQLIDQVYSYLDETKIFQRE